MRPACTGGKRGHGGGDCELGVHRRLILTRHRMCVPGKGKGKKKKKQGGSADGDDGSRDNTLVADVSTMLVGSGTVEAPSPAPDGDEGQGGLPTVVEEDENEEEDDPFMRPGGFDEPPSGATSMMGEVELLALQEEQKRQAQPFAEDHPADHASVNDWYVCLATRMTYAETKAWGVTEGPIILPDNIRFQYDTELPLTDYAADAAKRQVGGEPQPRTPRHRTAHHARVCVSVHGGCCVRARLTLRRSRC